MKLYKILFVFLLMSSAATAWLSVAEAKDPDRVRHAPLRRVPERLAKTTTAREVWNKDGDEHSGHHRDGELR